MDNQDFAKQIYEFLRKNEASGHLKDMPEEDGIAEIAEYLADLHLVRETIRDIENISDYFDDHEVYVSEVKPLLQGLMKIEAKLEAEQSRRMVSDTGYEVKHSFRVGDREIIYATNEQAADCMHYFVGEYTENDLLGQYANCIISDDYLEAVADFSDRTMAQVEATRKEIATTKRHSVIFTLSHCHPHDYGQSIDGKIVALRAEIFRPEYRRGDVQIILVDGGSGARANPNGRTIFGYHLNDGNHSRFYRSDVLGEVKPEHLPAWARDKAAAILADKAAPQKKTKDREER